MVSRAAITTFNDNLSFPEPFIDEPGGAAYPGVNHDSGNRAILRTGAALHAGVEILNMRQLLLKRKHLVRTDFGAHSATDTDRLIQLERRDIFQILESLHHQYPLSTKTFPAAE
jgi:hypothetical protein